MKIYEKYKNDFDFDLNKKKPNDFLTLNRGEESCSAIYRSPARLAAALLDSRIGRAPARRE